MPDNYSGTGVIQNQGFGATTAGYAGTTGLPSATATSHKSADIEVPQARQAMERLKQETASELGIPNYQGYLGDLPARENGAVGGHMVRKMIRLAESQLSGGATAR